MKQALLKAKNYFEEQLKEASFDITIPDSNIKIQQVISEIVDSLEGESEELSNKFQDSFDEFCVILDNAEVQTNNTSDMDEEDEEYSDQILMDAFPIPKHPRDIQDKAQEVLDLIEIIIKGASKPQ